MGNPNRELSKGTQCFRIFFIIANFLFLALGVIVFALGIWLVVQAQQIGDTLTGDNYAAGGALLIVCGVIAGAICIVGLVGAIFMSRVILLIYIIMVLVVVIIEIAAGIFGFVYRDEISGEVEDRFIEAIEDYREQDQDDHQEDVNDAVDFVQDKLECCGARNVTDWDTFNNDYFCNNGGPPSDCRCSVNEDDNCMAFSITTLCQNFTATFNFSAWNEGCVNDLEDILENSAVVLGSVAIVFAVIEALFILIALGLCICIHRSLKQTVV